MTSTSILAESRPEAKPRAGRKQRGRGDEHRPSPAGARRGSRTMVNVALVAGLVYTVAPLLFVILAACKTASGTLSGDLFSFRELDPVANLKALAHQDGGVYFRWYLNSLFYAGVGAVGTGLICAGAGYAFDKFSFRGKEKLYGLVLVGVLVPGMATVLPLYLIASKIHLVNTVWAVLIPGFVSPFGVFLARIFSESYVPDEVMEAARIDGASDLRVFRSIGLPLLKPGIATVMLFQFSAIWQGFYLPYVMLNDQKLYPVSLGLYIWNYEGTTENPALVAQVLTGSALAILPIIAIFAGLQRYWRSGMTAGAVK
ncbi:MAG TPA: carbohydrate ABC transporter permease [Actinospica sp.]|nr:carbohydrate ABC transporter permease [Actinospica sp.]